MNIGGGSGNRTNSLENWDNDDDAIERNWRRNRVRKMVEGTTKRTTARAFFVHIFNRTFTFGRVWHTKKL